MSFAADDDEDLWEEHLPAWLAWTKISGQWRTVARGGMAGGVVWLGLDYGAAEAGLRLAGITLAPAQWEQVRVIEEGAVSEMNRER